MPSIPVSVRGRVEPFHVMELLKAANLRGATHGDVITLCAGQPSTPAPRAARDAAADALASGAVLGYTDATGTPQLRRAIADHYDRTYGLAVDPDQIAVTTGSSAAFTALFLAAFDPGDVVLMSRPGYPAYRNTLQALGCRAIELDCGPEVRFQPTPAMLAEWSADNGAPPTGVIVASPANPTGTVIEDTQLAAIARWCEDNGVLLISDEIYHGVTYGVHAASAWESSRSAVVVGSMSKYFSMTGWRVGWLVLPGPLVRPVELLLGNLNICAPAIAQVAATAAFGGDARRELEGHVRRYAANRDLVLRRLPGARRPDMGARGRGLLCLCRRLPPDRGLHPVVRERAGGHRRRRHAGCRLRPRQAGHALAPGRVPLVPPQLRGRDRRDRRGADPPSRRSRRPVGRTEREATVCGCRHRWPGAPVRWKDDGMNSPRAGQLAQPSDLVDVAHLVTAYYTQRPDPENIDQQVSFGTSGHRGSSLNTAFNEDHILATTQAICDYRRQQGFDGPLFIGRDTHGLSEPAWASALEVLAANDVTVLVDSGDRYTPTPALSHAILTANRGKITGVDALRAGIGLADGIVVTPSHNPPSDGGFKYNPPHGGPADTDATKAIAAAANAYIRAGLDGVRRIPFARARRAAQSYDFMGTYVEDLVDVIDLEAVKRAGVRIGADPLGGASVDYWGAIAERHGIDLTVVNPLVDPTWRFMTLDWDGKIRMDCSSPAAMAGLIGKREEFDLATGNDADADRHGVVTPDGGLMNPNHYLSVAISYLFGGGRPQWRADGFVGKTLVSSSMIDRVAADLGRRLVEVPVGFKWFVPGLLDGSGPFGGEESAGASFLRKDGSVWTTDKDGILLALLASEILAVTGRSPSQIYGELTAKHGSPAYARIDAPADREQKAKLGALAPSDVTADTLAGEPITAKLTEAPGNGAKIGGLKVVTENAWFAARPSGTEDVYKIYAESFRGPEHLAEVQAAAREVVGAALAT